MAEVLKEFYNGAIAPETQVDVVDNAATKQAFVKNIWVQNPGRDGVFDVLVDDKAMYKSVAIDKDETVKFEGEHMIIEPLKALTIKNPALEADKKLSLYQILYGSITLTGGTLEGMIHIMENGNYCVMFPVSGNGSSHMLIVTPEGESLVYVAYGSANWGKAVKLLMNKTKTMFVFFFLNQNNYLYYTSRSLDLVTVVGTSGSLSSSGWTQVDAVTLGSGRHLAVCHGGASSTGNVFWCNDSTGANEASTTIPADRTGHRLATLSNGNAVLVARSASGTIGVFTIFGDESTTPVVAETQFDANIKVTDRSIVPVGLSNGTFMIFFRDSGNNDELSVVIYNNDGTLNTAKQVVIERGAEAFTLFNAFEMPDYAVCLNYASSVGNLTKVHLLNFSGVITKTLPNFFTVSQPGFNGGRADFGLVNNDLAAFCMRGTVPMLTSMAINQPLSCKVDGVEVDV